MERKTSEAVTLFVDPTCPFAWITSRWLVEVSLLTPIEVRLELMSLSVVNEGRDLDGWYRDYNDKAWQPARIGAALLASPAAEAWPAFYSAFGWRRHVEGVRDDDANARSTLQDLGLPTALTEAADDTRWDPELRRRTAHACQPLHGDGGTPVLHLGPRAYFGPVLTAIPRGDAAVHLWQAVQTLAHTPQFSEIKGPRDENSLRTD
jgi:Mycothiol-dependent nitroreductase Rv2466c